jgi:hypothetical protein
LPPTSRTTSSTTRFPPTSVHRTGLYQPVLQAITPADCAAALRALWAEAPGRKIFVSGNVTIPAPATTIAAAYADSAKVVVAAPAKTEQAEFAYTHFGPTGEVTQRKSVDDLGATLLEFKNGVRLNLKATDFEAGRIRVGIRVGGGTLTMPMNQPGLSLLANVVFAAGGLGKHSADDLQRLLAGRTVGMGFGAQSDAFYLRLRHQPRRPAPPTPALLRFPHRSGVPPGIHSPAAQGRRANLPPPRAYPGRSAPTASRRPPRQRRSALRPAAEGRDAEPSPSTN